MTGALSSGILFLLFLAPVPGGARWRHSGLNSEAGENVPLQHDPKHDKTSEVQQALPIHGLPPALV